MLGKPIAVASTPFCIHVDCQLVAIQRLTPDVTNAVYATLSSRQDQRGYPRYSPLFELFKNNEVVVSARLHLMVQDDPFWKDSFTQRDSYGFVATEFLEAMTGTRPSFAVLDALQKTCPGKNNALGSTATFSGYRLTCEHGMDRPETNADHLTLSVMK